MMQERCQNLEDGTAALYLKLNVAITRAYQR